MRGFLTKPATVFSLDVALRGAVNDEPAAAATLEPTDVLDEGTLDALAAVDGQAPEPFLHKLIVRFLNGLPGQIATIQRASVLDDSDLMEAETHSLAGGAAAVGAGALARAARAVNDDPSSQRVAELDVMSRTTATSLTSWMSRRSPANHVQSADLPAKRR